MPTAQSLEWCFVQGRYKLLDNVVVAVYDLKGSVSLDKRYTAFCVQYDDEVVTR